MMIIIIILYYNVIMNGRRTAVVYGTAGVNNNELLYCYIVVKPNCRTLQYYIMASPDS